VGRVEEWGQWRSGDSGGVGTAEEGGEWQVFGSGDTHHLNRRRIKESEKVHSRLGV